jgi:glycosyltransferase involved in cell wall biosynthesis
MTPGRHVLMTTDAVGGVWTYTWTLAWTLAKKGWTSTIVSIGPAPRPDQFAPLLACPEIDLEITDLALEWQDPAGDDRQRALDYLSSLEDRLRPDIVHLNGYREACAGWRAPVVVAAHSCVGTWWRACRGGAPGGEWQQYLADVATGLASADRWVAPTAAFRDEIAGLYAPPNPGAVIWNGIAASPDASAPKEDFILAAGRLWDEAKNIDALSAAAADVDWPIRIAGDGGADSAGPLEWLGRLPHAELATVMQRAGIFVSPAVYEPFGLTVLEAAASGCALVLADIPTFRELWGGAALFVDPRSPAEIREALQRLCQDAGSRATLQHAARRRSRRYSLTMQAEAYAQLYQSLLARQTTPADLSLPSYAEVSA